MKKGLILLASGLLLAASLQALAAGAQQPVTVKGDEVTYNSKTGETVITGRVTITQAEGTISGDKAVYNMKNGAGEISGPSDPRSQPGDCASASAEPGIYRIRPAGSGGHRPRRVP